MIAYRRPNRKISRVKRNLAPSIADILFLVVAPITAVTRTIKLTHSDGDLAAHIRMGQVILDTGKIPAQSLASFTATNDPLVAHAWLSEILLATLYSVGGLALVSVVTGIIVATTHAGVALFLRSRGVDARWALAAAFISLAVSSTHWLARPHMFSILGVAITIWILESGSSHKWRYVAPLFVVWANLHGGWLYGLVIILGYVIGSRIEVVLDADQRDEWLKVFRVNLVALLVACLATLVTPFTLADPAGFDLHREVFSGATSSALASQMGEFMSPNFQAAAPLPFFGALLLTVALLAVTRRRMSAPHLIVLVMSLFFALRSFRNMALFGVSAWPLVALHVARAWPAHRRNFPLFGEIARIDKSARPGLYAAPVALMLIAIGLNSGSAFGSQIIRRDFSPKVFPVEAVARLKAASASGRIFEAWEWGGYIMYAWPSARLLVDPLKFNDSTVSAFTKIDSARPGWQEEIRRLNIETVIIHPDTPLSDGLERDSGWTKWYQDSTAVVFRSNLQIK